MWINRIINASQLTKCDHFESLLSLPTIMPTCVVISKSVISYWNGMCSFTLWFSIFKLMVFFAKYIGNMHLITYASLGGTTLIRLLREHYSKSVISYCNCRDSFSSLIFNLLVSSVLCSVDSQYAPCSIHEIKSNYLARSLHDVIAKHIFCWDGSDKQTDVCTYWGQQPFRFNAY